LDYPDDFVRFRLSCGKTKPAPRRTTPEARMTMDELPDGARPTYYEPGSRQYADTTSPHNATATQRPAAVAVPTVPEHVMAAVRHAAERGWRILPQATGHGASSDVGPDTVLLATFGLDHVDIDSATRVARAGAGATWATVNAAAAPHGLVGLSGSAPSVGVAGYTFGGGVGWHVRAHGMASGALRAVRYVDGNGALRTAADDSNDPTDREAMWAFRGAGGVGVAVELEFDLFPLAALWAGYALWPIGHLDAVVGAWATALADIGASVSTSISVLHTPPTPPFPDHLRGRPVVHLATASPGGPDEAAALRVALSAVAAPDIDTWGPNDAAGLAAIHLDPPMAVPGWGDGRWLGPEAAALTADILATAAPTDSPLAMVEIRNVDTTAPARPGAASSPSAPFLLHAVGIAPTPDARPAVDHALAAVRHTAAPADIGRSAASFAEGRPAGADALTPAQRERLTQAADNVDPHHIVHRSRFVGPPE
jgi:FAD/FMN-containing dehydrogenase